MGTRRRFARTAAVGAAAAAATLATLPFAGSSGAAPAPAQPAPFVNGVANAAASTLRIAPGVGSLSLAITTGGAVSEIANDLAQAQAQSLDLGLIGLSLSAENCEGDRTVEPEQLPQPTRVDNRGGDTQAASDEVPVAGGTFGGGREQAAASTQPLGRAEAVTEVIPGVARQAVASVAVGLDIAGVLRLEGLRWDAIHRTGADPLVDGSFTLGGLSIAGVPVPVPLDPATIGLDVVQQQLNGLLAPAGLRVELPRVEHVTEPGDFLRVTPLRIIIEDSELGATVFGPALGNTRQQREQLFDTIVALYCKSAPLLLVGDVGVSVLAGSGFLALDIGGVEVSSAAVAFNDPFGTAPPPIGLDDVIDLPLLPAAPPVAPAPLPEAAPAPLPEAAPAASPRGIVDRYCESAHPFQWPSCSEGAGIAVGALGLAATAVAGALDWRHQRRRAAGAR